mmetsp:Transcript_33622/g.62725  ORF Transcript_33622/g.62725 Transcript_33622/m.62725 type:complete len:244 (+) Transcript_33622:732-1463(+)
MRPHHTAQLLPHEQRNPFVRHRGLQQWERAGNEQLQRKAQHQHGDVRGQQGGRALIAVGEWWHGRRGGRQNFLIFTTGNLRVCNRVRDAIKERVRSADGVRSDKKFLEAGGTGQRRRDEGDPQVVHQQQLEAKADVLHGVGHAFGEQGERDVGIDDPEHRDSQLNGELHSGRNGELRGVDVERVDGDGDGRVGEHNGAHRQVAHEVCFLQSTCTGVTATARTLTMDIARCSSFLNSVVVGRQT